MLKQKASSHNLALRETRRQREEVSLSERPVDLLSFKDVNEKEEKGSAKKRLLLKTDQLCRNKMFHSLFRNKEKYKKIMF